MANITSIFKPKQGSSWNPWQLASRSGYNRPFSSLFPEGYFPTRVIFLAADFLNNLININGSNLAIGYSEVSAAMMGFSNFSVLNLSFSRGEGGRGTLGMAQRWYSPGSPRYGWSIGNHYKHQAYFSIVMQGMGHSTIPIIWICTPGVMGVESASNCRFRKVYLSKGKILSVRFLDDGTADRRMLVKICDKEIPPPDGLTIPTLTVHTMRGEDPETENISGILTSGWEVEVQGASDSFIQEGDFFELSQPLVIEDPATMHEYGLQVDNGFLRTNQQRYEIETDIIGFWTPETDPKLGNVYVANVSGSNQSLVTLPSSESEAIRNKEGMEYGNNSGIPDGLNTIRLITTVSGGPGLQNFCAGNLIGEFAEIGGKHYEIVEHPRGDTIAVSLFAMEDKKRLDKIPSKAKIFQQNFWMTNEEFFGIYRAYSSWGKMSSGGGSSFNWGFIEPGNNVFALEKDEAQKWGCKTLLERHFKDVGSGSGVKAYKKFERWIANINSKSLPLTDASVSGSRINVTLKGEYDQNSTLAFITYDEPYAPVSGVSQFTAYADFKPALSSMGEWTVSMDGGYQGGIWQFPETIPDDAAFSIVSNMYTVYPASIRGKKSYGLGNPFVYITTMKGIPQGIGYVECPLSGRPLVFFNDEIYGYLAYRTAFDPEWTEEIQQGLVRTGHYKEDSTDGTDFVTGMSFSGGSKGTAYWISTPNSKNTESPYFSTRITGAGGVETPFYRKVQLTNTPVSNDVSFPFEVYFGEGGAYSPAYISKEDSVGVGIEPASKTKAQTILSGGSVSGTSGGQAKFEYTPRNRLLRTTGGKDAFALKNGTIGLVGSTSLSNWTLDSGDSEDTCDALFVITTDNEAYDWGSPKVDKPNPNSNANDLKEWEVPLYLLFDFQTVGSLIKPETFELIIFGYVYEEGEESYRDVKKLSLAMYRVAIPDFIEGATQEIKDSTTQEVIGRYRPSIHSTEFGRFGSSGGSPHLNERFIKIIGNEDTNAQITDVKIRTELISPMWMGSEIRIFMYSNEYNGIISLISSNMGDSWGLERVDSGEPLMYTRGEGGYPALAKPGVFGQIDSHNLLFYIANNSLLCKKIDLTGEGGSIQEKLDNSIPVVVAVDVQEHKSVSTSDRLGRLIVYYLSSKGILTAAMSPNNGDHWETLKNF